MFLETTFLTTAGNKSEASFPLATICKMLGVYTFIHELTKYNSLGMEIDIGLLTIG